MWKLGISFFEVLFLGHCKKNIIIFSARQLSFLRSYPQKLCQLDFNFLLWYNNRRFLEAVKIIVKRQQYLKKISRNHRQKKENRICGLMKVFFIKFIH